MIPDSIDCDAMDISIWGMINILMPMYVSIKKDVLKQKVIKITEYKEEKEQFKEFLEEIEDFVNDNFEVVGLCSNCSDNAEAIAVPYDHKGSYQIEARKLFERIKEICKNIP